jgi:nucleoside-diphosphate kinase
LVYYGENAIPKVRGLAGATNPEEADSVSIRGAYGRVRTSGLFENVIHCSANRDEAGREIKLWFKPEDIIFDVYETEAVTRDNVKEVVWKQS